MATVTDHQWWERGVVPVIDPHHDHDHTRARERKIGSVFSTQWARMMVPGGA